MQPTNVGCLAVPGRSLPMSEMPYRIDLDSVRKAFPLWLEAPALLADFAAWLEGRAWGGVGCFDLVGQFSDNAPLFDSSLLRNEFALFMRLPDGSAVGTWYPDAGNAERAPVVLIPRDRTRSWRRRWKDFSSSLPRCNSRTAISIRMRTPPRKPMSLRLGCASALASRTWASRCGRRSRCRILPTRWTNGAGVAKPFGQITPP